MNIRHTLILGINTSILTILGVFCFWLYFSYSNDVERQVSEKISQSELTIKQLVQLRKQELTEIARSISTSPVLRSVISTKDRETIIGVLGSLAKGNNLDIIAIGDGKEFLYSFTKGDRDGLLVDFRSRFKGFASIPGTDLELAVAHLSSPKLLETWTKILDARIVLSPKDRPDQSVNNLWENSSELKTAKPIVNSPPTFNIDAGSFYGQRLELFEGNLLLQLFFERAPLWKQFETRRNELIVIGLSLFFLGILLSLIISNRIQGQVGAVQLGEKVFLEGERLIAEVEKMRTALLLEKSSLETENYSERVEKRR